MMKVELCMLKDVTFDEERYPTISHEKCRVMDLI